MSMLKKSLIGAGVAASLVAMSSAHASAYFTINSGYGTTAAFDVLESNVNATSTYTSPVGAVASFDSLIGIGAFVTDTSADGNVTGFLNGTFQLNDADDAGFGSNFRLLFDYTLSGTAALVDGSGVPGFADGSLDFNNNGLIDSNPYFVGPTPHGLDAILPNYTSGSISITYVDMTGTVLGSVGATQKVLELDLVSAASDGPNVVLMADVDYSWYGGGSALVEDMFHFTFSPAGVSWYDLWLNGGGDPIQILTRSDFNIDPNKMPVSTCGGTGPCATFARTTNLNVTTTVPEPGTIALLGIGLLGLGASASRKLRKA